VPPKEGLRYNGGFTRGESVERDILPYSPPYGKALSLSPLNMMPAAGVSEKYWARLVIFPYDPKLSGLFQI
jgi:hypothetical protein